MRLADKITQELSKQNVGALMSSNIQARQSASFQEGHQPVALKSSRVHNQDPL